MNTFAPEITIQVASDSSEQQPDHCDDSARWETEQSPSFPRPLCVSVPPKVPRRQVTEGIPSASNHSTSCNQNKANPQSKPDSKQEEDEVAAPPKYPRRRVSRVNKLTYAQAPHRPLRRESPASLASCSQDNTMPPLPAMDTITRLPSNGSSLTDTLVEEMDESFSTLSHNLLSRSHSSNNPHENSIRLEGSSSRFESSSSELLGCSFQDLSPARPTRQKTIIDEEGGGNVPDSAQTTKTTTTAVPESAKPDWIKLWESQGAGDFAGDASLANLWSFEEST